MVTLRQAREVVRALKPFRGSSIFAENVGERFYVVYSYGHHFPMYAYDRLKGHWIANSDKVSRSTTRQQSACRPVWDGLDMEWLDTAKLCVRLCDAPRPEPKVWDRLPAYYNQQGVLRP